ncbi:MAG: lysophospholipid acyltransferase family protein [Chitinophagaceae bacterium]
MFALLKKILHSVYVVYAFLVFFLLMLVVVLFVLLFIFFPEPKSGNYIYKTFDWWARVWFALIGIRHEIIYENGCDVQGPIVFVANHQSYMDIPVTVHSIKSPYRILGKSEMANIPIFGFIYKKAVIMVDRSDKSKRGHSYIALKDAIHTGLSVLVYPEGTFNETGKPLKAFYDGAFKLALNTQTDIQPMLILDMLERMHYRSAFALTPGKCRTVFLPKISIEGYGTKEHEKLKAVVHEAMEAGMKRYIK